MNIKNILRINWLSFIVIFFVLVITLRHVDNRGWLSIPVNDAQKRTGHIKLDDGTKIILLQGFPFATTNKPTGGTMKEGVLWDGLILAPKWAAPANTGIQHLLALFGAYFFSRKKVNKK